MRNEGMNAVAQKPISRTSQELSGINDQIGRCKSLVRELYKVKSRIIGERPSDGTEKRPQVDADNLVNCLVAAKLELAESLSEFEVILSELSEAV
ncbi:MAG: hypothetical protein KGJ13_02075 [Patescibacteria group bacterium]|nr:hypothetical protein [Patescibacteria group bacterium]